MSYPIAQIESLFSSMRRLAPALAFVRTDFRPAQGGYTERREVLLDKSPRRDTVVLSNGASHRTGSIARLATFFGVTRDEASELYGLVEQLHATNPVGSWCLAPSAIANATRLSSSTASSHAFLDDVLADLREALPTIASIQVVSSLQNLPQGHTRRRVLVRFRIDARHEAAAIDTAHFSAHLSSLLVGADDHAQRNVQRAQHWADQLGISVLDLPSVLHDLGLVAVSLPTTEILLNGSAEPATARKAAQLVR